GTFLVGRTTLGHGPFGPIPAASARAPVPLQACGACPHQDHVGQVTQQSVHHQVGFGVDGGRPAVVAHGCTVEGGDHVRACPRTCRGVGVGVELFECVLVGASVWCRYFGGGLVHQYTHVHVPTRYMTPKGSSAYSMSVRVGPF